MLTNDQRLTLAVLGYLYFRMGRLASAERVFAALVAASSEKTDRLSRQAHAALAAAAVENGKGEAALRHLHAAMDGAVLSAVDAPLHLLRARALWLLERRDEARDAVQTYMFLVGDPGPADGGTS